MKNLFLFAFAINLTAFANSTNPSTTMTSFTSVSVSSEDWGKTGHRAVGEIASKYVSRKARKAIAELLDGNSLAEVSIYADEIRSDSKYRKYGPWHYVNIPTDKTYEAIEKAKGGDIIVAINECIKVLKNISATKEDRAFHLKLLVHFIGDLHQPLHAGRAEDKGGNDIQVRWFNEGSNLHRVWDSDMIDFYKMSYTELTKNRTQLSKKEIKAIQSGSLMNWVYESRDLSKKVYASANSGDKLGYEYAYIYLPIAREQIEIAGLRLAKVLNHIF